MEAALDDAVAARRAAERKAAMLADVVITTQLALEILDKQIDAEHLAPNPIMLFARSSVMQKNCQVEAASASISAEIVCRSVDRAVPRGRSGGVLGRCRRVALTHARYPCVKQCGASNVGLRQAFMRR
jgi:hypothetical protein